MTTAWLRPRRVLEADAIVPSPRERRLVRAARREGCRRLRPRDSSPSPASARMMSRHRSPPLEGVVARPACRSVCLLPGVPTCASSTARDRAVSRGPANAEDPTSERRPTDLGPRGVIWIDLPSDIRLTTYWYTVEGPSYGDVGTPAPPLTTSPWPRSRDQRVVAVAAFHACRGPPLAAKSSTHSRATSSRRSRGDRPRSWRSRRPARDAAAAAPAGRRQTLSPAQHVGSPGVAVSASSTV
jgi:hypothetical protein